jgi:hypothetical protein
MKRRQRYLEEKKKMLEKAQMVRACVRAGVRAYLLVAYVRTCVVLLCVLSYVL